MNTPRKRSETGIPVGTLVVVLGALSFVAKRFVRDEDEPDEHTGEK